MTVKYSLKDFLIALCHKTQYFSRRVIEENILIFQCYISKTKKIEHDKLIFRFISEDAFLNLTKVGDIYENESFISCTRKPSINIDNFGYIILKFINLNKTKT